MSSANDQIPDNQPPAEANASSHESRATTGPGEAAAGDRASTDAERDALLRDQLKRLRVADVADDVMISLVTLGYQKLGLTGETRELRDLADARLAIDLLRAMVDVLAHEQGESEIASFRSTLAEMQLSYARVAGERPVAGEAAGSTGSGAAADS
ncbi:MAG: hypothetical protein ACLQUT_03860 [Thermoleophilia bacterium]